jgi:predicted nuclease of predicted toxin-antitoxin system
MPPPKLHLNEHISPRLAEQLRKYGFDVTSTLELGMVEADDDEQLAYAASQQRAIVTFNHKDFATRHEQYLAEGKEHWGIVLSTEETTDVLRHRLLRLLNTLTAKQLKNDIRRLNDFK